MAVIRAVEGRLVEVRSDSKELLLANRYKHTEAPETHPYSGLSDHDLSKSIGQNVLLALTDNVVTSIYSR